VKFLDLLGALADLPPKNWPSEKTFYRWREKYAGMDVGEAKRLRELEDENIRLEKLLAEQVLHNEVLRDVLAKKWFS